MGRGAGSQVGRAIHSPEKQQTAAPAVAGCQDLSPGSTDRHLTTSANLGPLNRGETAGDIASSPGEHKAGADFVNPALSV